MTNRRRRARQLAFETLFELEARPDRSIEATLRERTAALEEETGEVLNTGSVNFILDLLNGVSSERESLDRTIGEIAPAFPVDQMPPTDRVALQLGVFELLYSRDAPLRVIINEAVELAKTYGSENSGRFVNGVLRTIVERLPAGDNPPADSATRTRAARSP